MISQLRENLSRSIPPAQGTGVWGIMSVKRIPHDQNIKKGGATKPNESASHLLRCGKINEESKGMEPIPNSLNETGPTAGIN